MIVTGGHPAGVREARSAVRAVTGDVDVWHVPVAERHDWPDLLDAAERQRAGELPAGSVRDTFVTSRAAQRILGAHYLEVAPETVTVVRDCAHCGAGHGKPRYAAAGGGAAEIDYSVSHTDTHLVVAVTRTGLVGIDVEDPGSVRSLDLLVRGALTADESRRYAALPREERLAWFLEAWTRKEAAMKLAGLGLPANPGRIDVGGPQAVADTVPGWPGTPVWLYDLAAPGAQVAALATTVPLVRIRTFELEEAGLPGGLAAAC